MLSEVHQADTFTNEAQITYQNAEKMQEAARRYGTMGSQEVEYRIEQLYRLNRPDLNL